VNSQSRDRRGALAIQDAFAAARAEGRSALITYLTLGYPSLADSVPLVLALQHGGADVVELGVPFSDPIADGPIIQQASYSAVQAGVTPRDCLEVAEQLRHRGVWLPLVFMGYYNPIYRYGLEAYVSDCERVRVDGLIVPDLPLEEAAPLAQACQSRGVALVFLVAPTSSEERIAKIAAATQGFVYVVSRLGTTGTMSGPTADLDAQLGVVRRYARTPIAVGFGIGSPEQIRSLAPRVEGIVVGSALVERAREGPAALHHFVSSLRAALGDRAPHEPR
jgi:tryptophan synthase alpha chain